MSLLLPPAPLLVPVASAPVASAPAVATPAPVVPATADAAPVTEKKKGRNWGDRTVYPGLIVKDAAGNPVMEIDAEGKGVPKLTQLEEVPTDHTVTKHLPLKPGDFKVKSKWYDYKVFLAEQALASAKQDVIDYAAGKTRVSNPAAQMDKMLAKLSEIAAQLGMSPEQVKEKLAASIPATPAA